MLSPFVGQQIGVILAQLNSEDLEYLAGLLADGSLTPRIDTRYSLADTAEALRYLETQRARGKAIITTDALSK
jgi:NADPH:quinone reductase-like Zn-dependent oxidoreductase